VSKNINVLILNLRGLTLSAQFGNMGPVISVLSGADEKTITALYHNNHMHKMHTTSRNFGGHQHYMSPRSIFGGTCPPFTPIPEINASVTQQCQKVIPSGI